MTTKKYKDQFKATKREILKRVLSLMGGNSRHEFIEPFYVHYIGCDIATTELCLAVEIRGISVNEVVLCTTLTTKREDEITIEGDAIYNYDPLSFVDILEHLQSDARKAQTENLRILLSQHNGRIEIEGEPSFHIVDKKDDYNYNCCLKAIKLAADGSILVENLFEGGELENNVDEVLFEDLENVVNLAWKASAKAADLVGLDIEQLKLAKEFENILKRMSDKHISIVYEQSNEKFLLFNNSCVKYGEVQMEGKEVDQDYNDITPYLHPVKSDCLYAIFDEYNDERVFCSF